MTWNTYSFVLFFLNVYSAKKEVLIWHSWNCDIAELNSEYRKEAVIVEGNFGNVLVHLDKVQPSLCGVNGNVHLQYLRRMRMAQQGILFLFMLGTKLSKCKVKHLNVRIHNHSCIHFCCIHIQTNTNTQI